MFGIYVLEEKLQFSVVFSPLGRYSASVCCIHCNKYSCHLQYNWPGENVIY